MNQSSAICFGGVDRGAGVRGERGREAGERGREVGREGEGSGERGGGKRGERVREEVKGGGKQGERGREAGREGEGSGDWIPPVHPHCFCESDTPPKCQTNFS